MCICITAAWPQKCDNLPVYTLPVYFSVNVTQVRLAGSLNPADWHIMNATSYSGRSDSDGHQANVSYQKLAVIILKRDILTATQSQPFWGDLIENV